MRRARRQIGRVGHCVGARVDLVRCVGVENVAGVAEVGQDAFHLEVDDDGFGAVP